MTSTRPGRQPCCQTPGCINAPDRETGDGEAKRETADRGHADRAWAEHLTGTLDASGLDLAMSLITRQDRWRLRSELYIRVSPLCT